MTIAKGWTTQAKNFERKIKKVIRSIGIFGIFATQKEVNHTLAHRRATHPEVIPASGENNVKI